MIRIVSIIICTASMVSCNGNDSIEFNSESLQTQEKSEVEQPNYNDIVPENISDSLKIEIFNDVIEEIDFDSTLIRKKIRDSTGKLIYTFYRNNALVKAIEGKSPEFSIDTLSIFGTNYNTYYFLMDSLIKLKYTCSYLQQTGSCNPVSAASFFYFYNGEIINESHYNNIEGYIHCGCHDLSFNSPLKNREIFLDEIKAVKGIIKTINTTSTM